MKKLHTIIAICWIISFNSQAQITFEKAYGDTNTDIAYTILQNLNGDYMILGKTTGIGPNSYADIYLMKTDSSGNLIWTKKYGGNFPDRSPSFQQTIDGGYILGGNMPENVTSTMRSAFLIKTDAYGDTLWTKIYTDSARAITGGFVTQTNDGGYALSGARDIAFQRFGFNVTKTDSSGNMIWSKEYSEPVTQYLVGNIRQTTDGGYILADTRIDLSTFRSDISLIKIDSSGSVMWSKRYGGTDEDRMGDIRQTSDGGYIVLGITGSFGAISFDVFVFKTDSVGNLSWSKTYAGTGTDVGYNITETNDGGYIISGSLSPIVMGGGNLIKINSFGDTLWTRSYPNTGLFDLMQTSDGGYAVAGSYLNDAALIKTDSNGNLACNTYVIPATLSTPNTIVNNTAPIVSNAPLFLNNLPIVVSNGGTETTICSPIGINETTFNNSFYISPNPSSGNFTISFESTVTKGSVEILNILGASVYRENIFNQSKKEIDVMNISPGIYFVKVFDGEKMFTQKIIVE